jgi:hypothetical protein
MRLSYPLLVPDVQELNEHGNSHCNGSPMPYIGFGCYRCLLLQTIDVTSGDTRISPRRTVTLCSSFNNGTVKLYLIHPPVLLWNVRAVLLEEQSIAGKSCCTAILQINSSRTNSHGNSIGSSW